MRSGDDIASEVGRILTWFSSGSVGAACLAPDGRLLSANPSLCRMVGRTERELAGTVFVDLIHDDDRDGYLDLLGSLRSGKVPSFELRSRCLHESGTPIWVQTHVSAVTDEFGIPEYLIAVVLDITEGWSARSQNARLFGFPLALVFVAGLDGYFKRMGAGYERLLGWTDEEMLSRPFFEFVHPDDLATLAGAIQEVAAGRAEVVNKEIRVLCKDGTYRWLMGNYSPVFDEGLIYGMAIDITERKQAEEALRESERRTRLILDTAYEAFISMDIEGRIIEWNAEAERVFGWPRQEAIGRLLADTVVPERYRDAHIGGLARYRSTGQGPLLGRRIEIEAIRPDGSEFPVELTISPTEQGDQVVFNAFLRDITERKQADETLRAAKAEAERAWEEAERASRAKSEFLSGMSHELRTPLNAILGFAQLLGIDDLGPEHAESVEHILRAGRHLLQLIDEVLDVARIEQGRLSLTIEPVSLDEIVQEACDLIRPLAVSANIRVWGAPPSDRHVLADHQRLKQVLMNLLANAVKYNREGGTVTVSCDPTPGDRVRISVADTGPGIPAEMMGRLFLPFERLGADRTTIEGTGIGLSLSKRLVELMGGEIGAESEVDRGSTFWVELDRAKAPEERAIPTADDAASAPTAAEERTVLYVEDNLSNLRLVERILARRPSVRLVAAMQGGLALDLARQHRRHLILLDVHLPDIEGDEVLRRLQADPETKVIPVVTVSAEATPPKIERFLAAGARAYLTKPIDVKRFLEVVDEILEEPTP